jgi:hypothetical protein
MNLTPRNAAIAAPKVQKKKPRGRPFPKGQQPWTFKPGQSGNPGGKPHIHIRFATRVAEELAKPASPMACRAAGLKRGSSKYDVMMTNAVALAMTGDMSAFVALRETCEGKLPNRNFNLTASMERFLEDPKFREFLEQAHGDYLEGIGVTENGTGLGVPASSPLHRILGNGRAEAE